MIAQMPRISPYVMPGITTAEPLYIIKKVCEMYGITEQQMQSKSREMQIKECRQVIHALIRVSSQLSLKQIGIMAGGKDHSTVLYSLHTVRNIYQVEKKFRDKVDKIARQCGIKDMKDFVKSLERKSK